MKERVAGVVASAFMFCLLQGRMFVALQASSLFSTITASTNDVVVDSRSSTESDPLLLAGNNSTSTTLVVTSNLIPSHPEIRMINETIQSFFQMVVPTQTPDTFPILIAIDGLAVDANDTEWDRLDKYIANLRQAFPKAQVIHQSTNAGLSFNVMKALPYVKTKYMYLIQHDMPFIMPIDHTTLVDAFETHPDQMSNVRFNKKKNRPAWREHCNQNTSFAHNGVVFHKSPKWSDNNQFAPKAYYDWMFTWVIYGGRRLQPMESTMMHFAGSVNCSLYGQQLYGTVRQGPFIGHLDGRLTQTYRRRLRH